jgi:hypothetical protein
MNNIRQKMKLAKPLGFSGGWMFQDSGEELAAFQKAYGVSLPLTFIERVWPYAEGLLSTNRKVGYAADHSVWWMTLLKLRLPKQCDWDAYHLAVENDKMSPVRSQIFHDLIPVYLEELREKFYDSTGLLRFIPFGGAHRFMPKPETLEEGFLCFEVSDSYAIWYLPAGKKEEYRLAGSFDEMMMVPQRQKKRKPNGIEPPDATR